jgi:transmembrane sensor
MPPEVDERLRERLARRTHPAPSRAPLWTLAGVAACAAAVAVVWLRPVAPTVAPVAPLSTGLAIEQASADLTVASRSADEVDVVRGRCTVVDARTGSSIGVAGPVALRRETRGVRVLRGRVEVAVRKRPVGAQPARVLVSHGVIEVMGTQFTVDQNEGGGRVALHEGAIRFVADDGRSVRLAPGEALSWPLPAPAAPAPAAQAAPPPPPVLPAVTVRARPAAPAPAHEAAPPSVAPAPAPAPVNAVLERVATLRSRARFAEAVDDLVAALGREYPTAARERLSFELGSLLTYQIGDAARACAHWRAHARSFGHQRYDREIEQAERTLGCRQR